MNVEMIVGPLWRLVEAIVGPLWGVIEAIVGPSHVIRMGAGLIFFSTIHRVGPLL